MLVFLSLFFDLIRFQMTRMAKFPRWNHLKHFNSITTTRFTDGNAFYDILKVHVTKLELTF